MENLGQYLRSVRVEKNLTIEAIHNEIKLTEEQITAIENNQLSSLGNYGSARAMVYSYIRFIEADEKIGMSLFDMTWPPQKQTKFIPKKPIKEKKVLISTNFIWLLTIILIVIILGSIIWVSYTKGYLKRPFEGIKNGQDSSKTETIRSGVKTAISDTLRTRMLEISRTSKKGNSTDEKKAPESIKSNTFTDTTDYVDEMIFNSKESPFNTRL
jgi:cytoskeletal protein RodZ